MLGWTLLFMLLSLTAAAAGFTGGVAYQPGIAAALVFGLLLIVSLLTRALRGQA